MNVEKRTEAIRQSLLGQLRAKGACVAHFNALIDDYISYFRLVERMKQSLIEDGMTYKAISASGKEYTKENPAAKLLPTYTKTMLSILREMGLTTDKPTQEDDDAL